jgi:hypothetical protein
MWISLYQAPGGSHSCSRGQRAIGCISLWIRAKTVDQDERVNAERRALFVGLWPPMFWLMGDSLKDAELVRKQLLGRVDESAVLDELLRLEINYDPARAPEAGSNVVEGQRTMVGPCRFRRYGRRHRAGTPPGSGRIRWSAWPVDASTPGAD